MPFISIRKKLISQVSRILLISFLVLITVVTGINLLISDNNLTKSEEHIRASLSAKASLLVNNNGQALIGMAEDYAFTSVSELVVTTVNEDTDIIYGIYMDTDAKPWIIAGETGFSENWKEGDALNDELSLWALTAETLQHKTMFVDGEEVLEYVAPVVAEGEILGFIRYGFSTSAMRDSLLVASEESTRQSLITSLFLALLALTSVGTGVVFVRKMANTMTRPLEQLTKSAEVISNGDYTSKIAVESNDEIGVLANNFDTMRQTISKKMDDLGVLNDYGDRLARAQRRNLAIIEGLNGLSDHFKAPAGWAYPVHQGKVADASEVSYGADDIVLPDTIIKALVPSKHQMKAFIAEFPVFTAQQCSCLVMPIVNEDQVTEILLAKIPGIVDELDRGDADFCQSLSRSLATSLKNIDMREVIEEQNRTLEHKVEERTAALQEKTNDILSMMENMHQGLFTVTKDRSVHPEYAAYCETIFETSEIAGQDAMHLLFGQSLLGANTIDQIKTALDSLLGEDEMMWDFNSHLLITECVIVVNEQQEKILEMDWDPIIFEDVIDKIMVTVRDVTELRSLQAEADKQKHELEVIGQILNVEEGKFASFVHSSRQFIAQCQDLIASNNSKSLDVVAELFRNMHTVKGNARTFGFTFITDSVHEAETTYDELRKQEEKVWVQSELLADLDKVSLDLDKYQTTAEQKLGRNLSEASNNEADKQRSQQLLHDTQQALEAHLPDDVRQLLNQTQEFLINQHAQPVTQVLASVVTSTCSLAKELDKPEPVIEFKGEDLLLSTEYHQPVQDIFMHLMRNSLDHGIEPADERLAMNKSAGGTICLKQTASDNQVLLTLSDDGRGLPLHKLFEKGQNEGAFSDIPTASEVANLIFASGMSTAEKVSLVSGRGVGMEAVKQFVSELGGDITLTLNDPQASLSGFAPFKLEVSLPKRFFYNKYRLNEQAA